MEDCPSMHLVVNLERETIGALKMYKTVSGCQNELFIFILLLV